MRDGELHSEYTVKLCVPTRRPTKDTPVRHSRTRRPIINPLRVRRPFYSEPAAPLRQAVSRRAFPYPGPADRSRIYLPSPRAMEPRNLLLKWATTHELHIAVSVPLSLSVAQRSNDDANNTTKKAEPKHIS